MRTFQKTEDQGDYVLPNEGTTAAVLTCLAFLGKHESTWNGERKFRELVGLSWELGEPGPDGRALAVSEILTASLHEKSKLFSRVLALCGGKEPPQGTDLAALLGRGAIVTTAHVSRDGKTYCNVVNVGPLPRGMAAAAPSVVPVFYDLESPDPSAYSVLPTRFRKLADTAIGTTQAAAPNPAGPWTGGGQAARPPAPPAGYSYAPQPPAAPPARQAPAPTPAWDSQSPAPPYPPDDIPPFDGEILF
jgi:hypothetical protein